EPDAGAMLGQDVRGMGERFGVTIHREQPALGAPVQDTQRVSSASHRSIQIEAITARREVGERLVHQHGLVIGTGRVGGGHPKTCCTKLCADGLIAARVALAKSSGFQSSTRSMLPLRMTVDSSLAASLSHAGTRILPCLSGSTSAALETISRTALAPPSPRLRNSRRLACSWSQT